MTWRTILLPAALLLGCSDPPAPDDPLAEVRVHPECADKAWVDLVVLDVWGRDVAEPVVDGGVGRFQLSAGEEHVWTVSAPGLVPAAVRATWSAEQTIDSLLTQADGGARVAVSRDVQDVGGRNCMVFGLFVGLDHPFYAASGRAPRAGNEVTLLLDGAEHWAAVYDDLLAVDPYARVHVSSWWWHSDFELVRPDGHEATSFDERLDNTMLALLRARPGTSRVIVSRFAEQTAPGMAYLNTDPDLREHGRDPDDGIEVMLQGNPAQVPITEPYEVPEVPFSFVARVAANSNHSWRTFHEPVAKLTAALEVVEIGSFHQKASVIGGEIAYVSGMNVKSTDWDTSEHRVFDHRRMEIGASNEERLAVMARKRLPDRGPRKDYAIRVKGPAARDVDDVLRVRWDLGMATGAMFQGDQTRFDLLEPAPPSGNVTAQVVATLPDPIQERSILETQRKACRLAKDLILIEDQYFRAPLLDEAIVDAMEKEPGLHLVVITKEVSLTDGGKKWTVLSDQTFRTRFPDRYLLLRLRNFDREDGVVYLQDMDTHSKLLVVDDVYLSVGSANKNNRGLLYEGELNVSVHDQAWVSAARNRVVANYVGPELAESVVGASGAAIFGALKALAEKNEAIAQALLADPEHPEEPEGFVYPLAITPDYLLDVGPDLY